MRWKVLLFESDHVRLSILSSWLNDADIECWCFDSANAAISALSEQLFDTIIIAQDFSGGEFVVLNHLRCRLHSTTPTLFIPATDNPQKIADTLRKGADEFLLQPLQRSDFVTMVKTKARHGDDQLTLGGCYPYEFDEQNHDIRLYGDSLFLTEDEYTLAAYLFFFRNRIILSSELARELCVDIGVAGRLALDMKVMRLKKQLRLKELDSWNLISLPGIGYRLNGRVNNESEFQFEMAMAMAS